MTWKINTEKTKSHWLELEWETGNDQHRSAFCKWDGCTEIKLHGILGPEEDESFHICDIDEMIADLQAIKQLAQEFYKGKQGEEHWK